LCSRSRWLLYYSHRIADDAHWGKNLSGLKFNEDGGLYMEALRDLKFVAGNAALQFLRGPMFSGMIKSDSIHRGQYDLSQLDEQQKRDRLFFGGGIPSVQAINGRPKPEDTVSRGGMHGPLDAMVGSLGVAYRAELSKLTKQELPRLAAPELKRKLDDMGLEPFDHSAAKRALQGERSAELVRPKAPNGGWTDATRPWWMPPAEPVVDAPPEPAEPVVGARAEGPE